MRVDVQARSLTGIGLSPGNVPWNGMRLASGAWRFSSVPYAQSPLGELRFQPPHAGSTDFAGRVDAGLPSPVALQNPPRLQGVSGNITAAQSEDCLRLTIWTPPNRSPSTLLPVLFWLHGGAFLTGGGALPWYDAERLCAEGNVVVVSPNYRLGVFGFLSARGVADGNMGLLDAEMALSWVRTHITAFGGDPDQITVMGAFSWWMVGNTTDRCECRRQRHGCGVWCFSALR